MIKDEIIKTKENINTLNRFLNITYKNLFKQYLKSDITDRKLILEEIRLISKKYKLIGHNNLLNKYVRLINKLEKKNIKISFKDIENISFNNLYHFLNTIDTDNNFSLDTDNKINYYLKVESTKRELDKLKKQEEKLKEG